ncbi:DtxR family iron (metal) dependent repressor [Thermosporothrix hazakensis]|jgi:DtxR family Mn-dependent transcriptional regulator|uniref:DtxR family iron (Metal) dependent repressor n=2 Tax=Thermosporothrix TaxID=768650 RepID=A0A326UDD8_THEHA|nr:metal-dependent transcriptional regulator [Thermosporothrix hazakensis]PZW36054.1 DtxR family iron (metal) dependent repressor [Thermosporothrix hazakensis]BBH88521.1 DNA-binding protein [Thermosporothrix sp. COM3]GCE46706.1 DNA-binding protein [Thermosporothrix hazakensis]
MKAGEALSATVEEYLEAIYNMSVEGDTVIGARLAEKFGVAAPTVTEMLKRLVKSGYIEMDNKRHITLTEEGIQAAEAVLRRHRLTERFLVEILGLQWHQVHEEACRLEHYISGAVEEKVIATLRNPKTCPHGNPIPGLVPNARNYLKDNNAVRLSTIPEGDTARILCISEVVEDEEALIMYLHEKGLTPEMQVKVISASGDAPTDNFTLSVDGREVVISKGSAAKIWVTR